MCTVLSHSLALVNFAPTEHPAGKVL
jgi:hypothetical protein